MGAEHHHHYDLNEQYVFSPSLKKNLLVVLSIGIVFLVIGILTTAFSDHGHDHAQQAGSDVVASLQATQAEDHGHGFSWTTRLFANMWINNVFFTGLALIGIFWVAIQYVASAGWSVAVKRVPEVFGNFLPIAAVLTIGTFLVANHDLFHWTHTYLYDKTHPEYDHIIDGKKAFFFGPGVESPSIPYFYYLRMVFFFAAWILFFNLIKKESLAEDLNGGLKHYRKLIFLSGSFLVFFGVSSSISAWDWVMSIDTHWFSTMFGWYVFASWFVSGLAAITLIVVFLKDAGYLSMVNENHLHDLGKFVFAFSVFWTYIWFSQFLLIYYANIPEESVYFLERLGSDIYGKYLFMNLILNFFFPFLLLMTRDAKRKAIMLKIVCSVILIGHWFDFFLMITPGTLKQNGGFGFMELGLIMIYASVFVYVIMSNLAKVKLYAANHPMLQESIHHTT
jgi:hypothetical protein